MAPPTAVTIARLVAILWFIGLTIISADAMNETPENPTITTEVTTKYEFFTEPSRHTPYFRALQEQSEMNDAEPTCTADITFPIRIITIASGDPTLVSQEQLDILASTYLADYNELYQFNTTTFCDPFNRTIVTAVASLNVSLAGLTDGIRERELDSQPIMRRGLGKEDIGSVNDEEEAFTWAKVGIKNNAGHPHRLLQGDDDDEGENDNVLVIRPSSQANRTTTNAFAFLIEISYTCRRCPREIGLFDDVSDVALNRRHRQIQVLRGGGGGVQLRRVSRELQPEDDTAGGTDGTCSCPENSTIVTTDAFTTTYNESIQELREEGSIDGNFVEEVQDVVAAEEIVCPSNFVRHFNSMYEVQGISFGSISQTELEIIFLDTYTTLGQQVCDPLFRSLSSVQFDSISNPAGEEDVATLKFAVRGTCRGDECSSTQCIVEDSDAGCTTGRRSHRNALSLHEEDVSSRSSGIITGAGHSDEEAMVRLSGGVRKRNLNILNDGNTIQSDNESGSDAHSHVRGLQRTVFDRCFCATGAPVRSVGGEEFAQLFQSNVNEVARIIDTCTVPCETDDQCESGTCGSVVCLPDTQLLDDGCLSSVDTECQSGRSEDGICVPRLEEICAECDEDSDCLNDVCVSGHCGDEDGLLPDDCQCSADSDCQSEFCASNGVCEENDTPAPTPEPTTSPTPGPTPSPTASPTPSPSTLPSPGPSPQPSQAPSPQPSPAPSSLPTTAPSPQPSPAPSVPPSQLPTTSPSINPTTSPTIGPSIIPTPGPTIIPTTDPTFTPTRQPTNQPTSSFGPSGIGPGIGRRD